VFILVIFLQFYICRLYNIKQIACSFFSYIIIHAFTGQPSSLRLGDS